MPAPDPLLGTAVGRYQVVRVIGAGGMGRVYEGVHADSGDRVALKVLAAKFADDAEVGDRMFAEARAVNLIRHAQTVPAFDVLRLGDGRPVLVMELVDGLNLREALAGRDAPLGGVVDVILQVLDVLAAAHAVGIVHRDLKPDNILITPGGHARVLDFGIAKLMHPSAEQPGPRTRTGVVLGTPHYMAPEHIRGGVTSDSVDLYAIGVVMFEAVTGRPPFAGATDFEVLRAHVDAAPPSARALRPELPVELDRLIDRALAKHPRDRFASATAMASALRMAAQALPDQAFRSLSPSGPAPVRPTVPTGEAAAGEAFLPTALAGRLDVPTAKARSDAQAAERDRPAPPPVIRARWIAPVVASLATAGVIAVVLSVRGTSQPVASPPVEAPGRVATDAPAVAVDAAPVAAVVDAAGPTPDPSGRPAAEHHADPRDDVFAFADAVGFERCLRLETLTLRGAQVRVLPPEEIQARCVTAAVQRLATQRTTASPAYLDVVKRVGIAPALALDLVDLIVRRSRSSCNDLALYELLVDVFEQGPYVAARYVAHARAIVTRCLKDDRFRNDFLDELHSRDRYLAAAACEILIDQKLVASCP